MWDEALRVAKSQGGLLAYQQIAYGKFLSVLISRPLSELLLIFYILSSGFSLGDARRRYVHTVSVSPFCTRNFMCSLSRARVQARPA